MIANSSLAFLLCHSCAQPESILQSIHGATQLTSSDSTRPIKSCRPLGRPICGVEYVHMAKSHQLQVRAAPLTPVALPPVGNSATPPRPTPESFGSTRPTAPPEVPFAAEEHRTFVWLHGREGTSQCRHCLRPCDSWYNLRLHVPRPAKS